MTRRLRRRPGRWWLSLVLAAAAGAAAVAPLGAGADGADTHPAVAGTPHGTGHLEVPPGHAALALARGEPALPAVEGDHVDLLATDLATGRASLVARSAQVLDVAEDALTVAVRRADLPQVAGAANQGLLVAVLVPPP